MAHITSYLHGAAAAAAAAAPGTPGADPLFLCDGRATSAPNASKRVAALATGLTQQLGLQVGDRVCLAALATDAHLEALLAAATAGAVAAPLNWRWSIAEAAHAAQLVGARLLLADAACLPFALTLAGALRSGGGGGGSGGLTALVLLGPPSDYAEADLAAAPPGLRLAFAEALIRGCPDASLALYSAPGNVALIVYTSGTTGRPKGVALTHSALHCQSMAKLLMCGYSAADVYLHAAPFFHIGGLSSALAMLAAGARHVFLPRFDGAAALQAIQAHGVTSFIAVPAMVADLLAAAREAHVAALPSVTRILVGGGGMSLALQEGLAALCPAATVHTAYGMTEGASSLTFTTLWGPSNSGGGGHAPAGTAHGAGAAAAAAAAAAAGAAPQGPPGGVYVGRPPPGIELAVYQPPLGGLGQEPASGSTGSGGSGRVRLSGDGEVLTRGPHVMLGYWDDDEATAATQLPGGWLRTGDLGCLRQGQLWLLGRAKDMIKSGGENVHAWEVERALGSHPAVAAAAVVGAAHWRLGEAVAAAVVLHPGWCWQGDRCQVLLPATAELLHQQKGQAGPAAAAARSALAAAAAAVAPRDSISASGGGSIEEEDEREEQQAAGSEGAGMGDSPVYNEDLHSTLLQRSASRPGSAQRSRSDGAGLLATLLLPLLPAPLQQQQRCLLEALQQLRMVAAGLQHAAKAATTSRDSSDSGSSGASDKGEEGTGMRAVDGRALQQHCRAAGLAGFKLPRVFLLCDAAGAAGAASGSAAPSGSGRVLLPVNSTGKVVKHLLREQVQQHMQAASRAAARGGSPRSRL